MQFKCSIARLDNLYVLPDFSTFLLYFLISYIDKESNNMISETLNIIIFNESRFASIPLQTYSKGNPQSNNLPLLR